MEYLKVKNWTKFQHYKQLSDPPWIKLHRKLLTDPDFGALSDRNKAHLILLWLIAAQYHGSVPADASFLRRRLGTHVNPDLKLFIKQGWLLKNYSVSSQNDSSLDKNRIEKNRKEESKPVDKSLGNVKSEKRLADYFYKKPTL